MSECSEKVWTFFFFFFFDTWRLLEKTININYTIWTTWLVMKHYMQILALCYLVIPGCSVKTPTFLHFIVLCLFCKCFVYFVTFAHSCWWLSIILVHVVRIRSNGNNVILKQQSKLILLLAWAFFFFLFFFFFHFSQNAHVCLASSHRFTSFFSIMHARLRRHTYLIILRLSVIQYQPLIIHTESYRISNVLMLQNLLQMWAYMKFLW